MPGETARRGPLPVVDFLKLPEGGEPYLEGQRCKGCGATYLRARKACAKCGERGQIELFKMGSTGNLYVYSIVHRSFPGVEVPYVSAIVDVDGGGTLKGNLIHVEPDPETIQLGMPVEIIFGDALGRKDRDGGSYISYFFQPRS